MRRHEEVVFRSRSGNVEDNYPMERRVQLFAFVRVFVRSTGVETTLSLRREGPLVGSVNGHIYSGSVPADRPLEHYTPRIVAVHPLAKVPLEAPAIHWWR